MTIERSDKHHAHSLGLILERVLQALDDGTYATDDRCVGCGVDAGPCDEVCPVEQARKELRIYKGEPEPEPPQPTHVVTDPQGREFKAYSLDEAIYIRDTVGGTFEGV